MQGTGTRCRLLVGACFFLSGLAGLLYETVWFRQFAAVFGTSEAALGAVLAGYMGGLAAGAMAADRWGHRVRRPLLAYGLLELGVAAGAMAIPLGLRAAAMLRQALCGGQTQPPDAGGLLETLVNTGGTFLLMLPPTACMGATLPMLAAHLMRDSSHREGRLAWLYGLNTLGAVCGTLLAAFACLPYIGLTRTVWVGAGLNALIFALIAWTQRSRVRHSSVADPSDSIHPAIPAAAHASQDVARPLWLLLLVWFSGFVVFVYEITWTRILGHTLGGSVYAFATMLSAFLAGLTLGSLLAARGMRRRPSPGRGIAIGQLVAACGSAGALFGVQWLTGWKSVLHDAAPGFWTVGQVGLSLLVLLPSTVGLGMTLPLAMEWSRGGSVTGRLFAANTVGAICGALLTGNLILPELGFRGAIGVGIAISLLMAAGTLAMSSNRKAHAALPKRLGDDTNQWRRSWRLPQQWSWRGIAGTACAVLMLMLADTEAIVRTSPLLEQPIDGRMVFSAVGQSSTVALIEQKGELRLFTNGLPEAVIAPRGAVAGAEAGLRWLTALPYLARPDAQSVLIIGFGGGGAVSGVPPSVGEIHAIELEPHVIRASRRVASRRLHDPLKDGRLRIIHNDARAALALTQRTYDVIVSQPSHPWTSGASHLYTREFLRLAREHLTGDGVFVQWMDAKFVDEHLLQTIGATLLDSFSHARLYEPYSGTLLFLASQQPLDVEEQILRTGKPLRAGIPVLQWLGLNDLPDVVAALALNHDGLTAFCAGSAVNTDDDNRLAMASPQIAQRATASAESLRLDLDPLLDRPGQPSILTRLNIDSAAVVRRLLRMQFAERAERLIDSLVNPIDRARARGMLLAARGDHATARQEFFAVLAARPADRTVRFKLLEPMLQLAAGQGSPEFVQLVSGSSAIESAVVDAAGRYYRRDYSGLAALDGQLALARPHDACFPLALCFRGMWRTKVTNSSRKAVLGQEAVELADRALAIEPTVFGGLVRLWAAKNVPEPDAYVESAAFLVQVFQSQPNAVSAASAKQIARQVLDELDRIERETQFDRGRISDVRELYAEVENAARSAQ